MPVVGISNFLMESRRNAGFSDNNSDGYSVASSVDGSDACERSNGKYFAPNGNGVRRDSKPGPPPPPKPGKKGSITSASQQAPGSSTTEPFNLTIGFSNSSTGRYLTAEKFNNRIHVLGNSLKQRQQWTLEFAEPGVSDIVYIKSASGNYLSANSKGAVSCDSKEKVTQSQFVVEFERVDPNDNIDVDTGELIESAGRWALRNVQSGAYLGVWSPPNKNMCKNKQQETDQADSVICRIDKPSLLTEGELWHPQLSTTPMTHVKNFGRQRFAHLSEDGTSFLCNDIVPWGKRCLFMLEYFDGKYAIRSAANGKYLHR